MPTRAQGGRRHDRQSGTAPIELLLGIVALLLPAALIAAVLPTWSERQGMAVTAATEAARAVALADDWESGHAAALQQVALVAANHGLAGAVEDIALGGELIRGGAVTAEVTVRIPLTALPFAGEAGGWSWTARHREPVDPYRSFPR